MDRLGELRGGLVFMSAAQQVLAELEPGMGFGDFGAGQCQLGRHPLRVQHIGAGSAVDGPVAHRVQVHRLDPTALGRRCLGHGEGAAVHGPKTVGRSCGFGRADDAALLVDPQRLRHVDQVVQVGQVVVAVDQAGVGRCGSVNPGPGGLGLVQRHGQDRETVVLE